MSLYEPILPTRYLAALAQTLSADDLLHFQARMEQAGLDPAKLCDGRAAVPMPVFDALFQDLVAHTGRSDLGYEMGRIVQPSDHGPLVPLIYRCQNLEQLFQLATRYFRLITPLFWLNYQRCASHAEFLVRPAAPMSSVTMSALLETYAVSTHPYLMAALGTSLQAYDVHLSIAAPPHRAKYQQQKPGRYHFQSGKLPQVQLIIPLTTITAPMRLPTREASGELVDLERLQSGIGRAQQWSGWIRLMLNEAEGCQPTTEDFAQLLRVSARTLSRTLAQEGMSLRDMAKLVRYERACAMLADPVQAISQIAYRLGYTDVANFSHAFRAMAGMSPRAFRLSLAA